MMHSPLFQIFPLFLKKISDSVEKFHNFTFSRKNFFSHRPQISNFPPVFEFLLYFLCFSTFPSVSGKLLFPPTFSNFPLFPKNSRVFYMLYVYFVSTLLSP